MGNRVSAISSIRSPNLFAPGNAINEIWFGDLEIISRLPFGDSDLAQAGWPKHDYPKIPWHPFIIPLRAAVASTARKAKALYNFSASLIPATVASSSGVARRSASSAFTDAVVTAENTTGQLSPTMRYCLSGNDAFLWWYLLLFTSLILKAEAIMTALAANNRSSTCARCSLPLWDFKSADGRRNECRCPETLNRMESSARTAELYASLGSILLFFAAYVMESNEFELSGLPPDWQRIALIFSFVVCIVCRLFVFRMWYKCFRLWYRKQLFDNQDYYEDDSNNGGLALTKSKPHDQPVDMVDIEKNAV